MKLVIAFDVDGTLVHGHGKIHPADAALLLNPPADVLFVPNTGRPLSSMHLLFQANRMWSGRSIPLPMALQNGSVLYRPGEELLFEAGFTPEVKARLVAIAHDLPALTYNFFTRDEIFTLWMTDFAAELLNRFGLQSRPFDQDSPLQNFTKLTADCTDPAMLQAFAAATADLDVEHSVNIGLVHEINPPGVNKGSGLLQLLAGLDVQPDLILAAGDSGNDLRIFEQSDLRFAPLTSSQRMREKADYVVDVERDGLFAAMLARAG